MKTRFGFAVALLFCFIAVTIGQQPERALGATGRVTAVTADPLTVRPGATTLTFVPVAAKGQNLHFRTGVDLVRLNVPAQDEQAHAVRDLTIQDLRISEDGVEQEIIHFSREDAPISMVVLLDKSLSMAHGKLAQAKDGVISLGRALRPQDQALLIAFSDSVDVMGPLPVEAADFQRMMKRIGVQRQTRLYDGVVEASRRLAAAVRNEKRAIVILSDGADTASLADLSQAIAAIGMAGASVYAIGIKLDADEPSLWRNPLWTPVRAPPVIDILQRLTDGTGGSTYAIPTARHCTEICLRIADELRQQYLVGYYPANEARDGRWRTIEMRSSRPGVKLVTRAGYYAPGGS